MEKNIKALYPGKTEFDKFLSSLPVDKQNVSFQDKINNSLKLLEIFNKGIPQKDRPLCIYYFYKLLPLWDEIPDNENVFFPPEVLKTINDIEILSIINQLDEEKLYEVCQIRGELNTYPLRAFINEEDLLKDWPNIKNDAEKFLESEPALPLPFLETYFAAYDRYFQRTNELDERLYELATQVVENSTSPETISYAYIDVNDGDLLDYYYKRILPPEDVKKLYALENLEEQILAEFGEQFEIRNKLGKALNFLSKKRREEREAQKKLQDEWIGLIRSKARSIKSTYVEGFRNYLFGLIYINTDDANKAVKSFEKAFSTPYNKLKTLDILIPILDIQKRKDELAQYAQHALDIFGIEDLGEVQKDDKKNEILMYIKEAGHIPKSPTRLYEGKAKDNLTKIESLKLSLKSDIESFKKENQNSRTKMGIELLDNLIPVSITDKAINSGKSFNDAKIDLPIEQFRNLSLEELELFSNNDNKDKLISFYKGDTSLNELIDYISKLSENQIGKFQTNINDYMINYPNYSCTHSVLEKYIPELVKDEHIEQALNLSNFAIDKREEKVKDIYKIFSPLKEKLHIFESCQKEIEFIKKVKPLLFEEELNTAIKDFTEAYLKEINYVKSLKKKLKLLTDASNEKLKDERLDKLTKEVDAQLNYRKKIITRVALVAGGIIIIAIVLFLILK